MANRVSLSGRKYIIPEKKITPPKFNTALIYFFCFEFNYAFAELRRRKNILDNNINPNKDVFIPYSYHANEKAMNIRTKYFKLFLICFMFIFINC